MRRAAPVLLALLVVGCRHPQGGAPLDAAPPEAPAAEETAQAEGRVRGPLTWIEDDYPAALAAAKARGVPLFVDLWAPWCHTCLSMKQTVFVDPSLAPLADRFVWVELDADRPENAEALTTLPPTAMPTFYVVSPVDTSIQARLTGSATVAQIRDLLAQGERGHRERQGEALPPGSPLAMLRAADRAVAAGDRRTAEAAYRDALAAAPVRWSRAADVLVSRISNLYALEDWEACVALGAESLDRAAEGRSASASDFAWYAHACGEHLPDDPAVTALRRRIVAEDGPVRRVLDDASAPLSVDDRSDGLRVVREVHEALGEVAPARALAERQVALIDAAWVAAESDHARMLWGWPRSEVYVWLGRGDALVPELRALVEALPEEYDPPYRLAWVLLQTGDLDGAETMARKATGLAYGPRQARAFQLLAAVHEAQGDEAARRESLAEALAVYEGLPEGQRRPEAAAALREELAEPAGR